MSQVSYQWFPEPEQVKPQTYFRFSDEQSMGEEITIKIDRIQTSYNRILKNINVEPVYVDRMANELVYNSRIMEKGKQYHMEWGGEHFMLIRGEDGVAVYVRDDDDERTRD
ncbi:MAG: hypothetical protein F4Y82_02455 [Cenarchaeum sp. SB0665_bin_23]|nr:hypothetical protein [Cenarchaeum sp. SB0665_bin_23]MYG32425.1 hypothetical protein [Cenarchaeum sp. SB0677_bin_16]